MEMWPEILPKKGSRIVVAMSGGVDSSVTAAWLKSQGYDVVGISLQLHDFSPKEDNKFGSCCSLSDIQDARGVAEKMEIPFYVSDMEVEFNEAVIDDFVQEYLNGRTPNPCVRCNEKVKFSKLLNWAMDLGADYLATGHYARIRYNPEATRYELLKGTDPQKDQSYFLFTLRQKDLGQTLFPIGHLDKRQVRDLAKKLNLRVAGKPDSQEICFVQSRSYTDFIEESVPQELRRPGTMVDPTGKVLAEHSGLYQFTIGQRKGLGVTSDEPLYVLELRAETNEVVIGPERGLFRRGALVANTHWIIEPEFQKNAQFQAKIRYRSKESNVKVTPYLDGKVQVEFEEPQRAITPGQAMVFYKDDTVYGGGWIEQLPIHL